MTKLIPDPIVAKERYHVHLRTLGRWDQTPGLGFPPPVYVKQRKYRSADLLDLWDLHNSREAAERATKWLQHTHFRRKRPRPEPDR